MNWGARCSRGPQHRVTPAPEVKPWAALAPPTRPPSPAVQSRGIARERKARPAAAISDAEVKQAEGAAPRPQVSLPRPCHQPFLAPPPLLPTKWWPRDLPEPRWKRGHARHAAACGRAARDCAGWARPPQLFRGKTPGGTHVAPDTRLGAPHAACFLGRPPGRSRPGPAFRTGSSEAESGGAHCPGHLPLPTPDPGGPRAGRTPADPGGTPTRRRW